MKSKILTIAVILFPTILAAQERTPFLKLANAAISIIDRSVVYDPAYTKIDYPNGDIAKDKGVCTDVIIRAYRTLNVDLQKEVHEDMKANFNEYPSKRIWGLKSTDRNIDHRRVPNLQTYFTRKGKSFTVSGNAKDYLPGDIVTWDLGRGIAHIGIIINQKTKNEIPLVVHNYGDGQIKEDILFEYKITGHYRYEK